MKIMYVVVSYPGGIQARFERLADAIMLNQENIVLHTKF